MDAVGRSSEAKYECLLFGQVPRRAVKEIFCDYRDMDDTLYPMSSGLNLACRRNIIEFMLHHLHMEETEVPRMCVELYKEYGTTMAGLKALGYEFDNDEFHEYVHGRLPYEVLKPDPVLRNLLLSMPQRKIIFTNGDKAHVAQVLSRLGLEDCFEGIICFETLNPQLEPVDGMDVRDDDADLEGGSGEVNAIDLAYGRSSSFSPKSPILCKPSVEAMEAAIQIADVDPKKTIFFDDSTRNIASGKVAGLRTVLVGSSTLVPGADHALRSIHNIREALPEIWEGAGELIDQLIQPNAVETVVLA